MKPQEFIEYRLNELKSTYKKVENFSSNKELANFIFQTIMSKKFRKYKVTPDDYVTHIQEAIKNSIQNNLPIKFCWMLGGYKLWRLEESPAADWAALFTIMYLAK